MKVNNPQIVKKLLSHGIISMGAEFGVTEEEAKNALEEVSKRNKETLDLFGKQLIMATPYPIRGWRENDGVVDFE